MRSATRPGVDADRRPPRHGEPRARDERLDLDQHRPAALERREHGRARARRPAARRGTPPTGFGTSVSPPSPISNTATSLVDPKRFFTARSTRSACAPSPSK